MPKQVQTFDDATRKLAKLVGKPGANKRIQTGQVGDAGAAGSQRFVNPMTTQDDLIVGGASGALTRLAKGSDGQVLTVDPITHRLIWSTPAAAYTDEQVRDVIGAALVAGTNITITVDDAGNTITIAATGGSSYTDEQVRDVIGAALVAGNNVDITVNDAGDTITIDVEALTEADIASLVSDLAGKQPLDTDLTAIAALPSAADKFPYATGAGTWALTDLSAFLRTLLDDADAATARATLGITGAAAATGAAAIFGGWVSQNYYTLAGMVGGLNGSTAGNAITADTMHACLFHVPTATTFDQIAVQVLSLVALSTIRLGVYAVGTDGKPGALIADWGTVSSAAVATPTLGISWSPAAGWYYLVQVSTHGPSTLRMSGGVPVSPYGIATTTIQTVTDWTKASAGSSAALPNPFGVTPTATGAHRPLWLRAA